MGAQSGNQLYERGEEANTCAAQCRNNLCETGESAQKCSVDCPQ